MQGDPAIDDREAGQFLPVALLGGGQFGVEDEDIRAFGFGEGRELFGLAAAEQIGGRLAAELDHMARTQKVPLFGSGVNPGFVMDLLPIILTGVCRHVRSVHVTRVLDADSKRLGFQKKIGAGMSVREFNEAVATGHFGHIGLPESTYLVAHALGWKDATLHESLEPVIADIAFDGRLLQLEAGQVAGLRQTATAHVDGKAVVTLEFVAYLGAPDPRDETQVEGSPDISMRIQGGVPGDVATAAVVVNSIPVMMLASPGLHTAADMVPLHSTHV